MNSVIEPNRRVRYNIYDNQRESIIEYGSIFVISTDTTSLYGDKREFRK